MDHPVSITFNDLYIVQLENYIAAPLKPKFCKRYVIDMFNRRKD